MLTTMTDGRDGNPLHDPKDERWKHYLRESYMDDTYHNPDIDERHLERMEAEFFDATEGERSPFGRLDELEE